MTYSTDLLDALYGSGYAEPITIEIGDAISLATVTDLESEAEPFRFFPINQDTPNLAFIYGSDPDVALDAWKDFKLRPTAVLAKEHANDPGYGLVVYFWAVETPVPASELQPVIDKFSVDLEEAIPTPSIEGWVLLHADPNECQTVEALIERYGTTPDDEPPEDAVAVPEAPEADIDPVEAGPEADVPAEPAAEAVAEEPPPWEEPAEPAFWGAARIATPGYDPATDPELDQVFTISLGAKINSKNWQPKEMTGRAIWQNLSNAKQGAKDGPGFVGGDLAGTERKASNVKALYVPGLDVDVGMPLEEAVELAKASSYKTLIYTTHSHMKTRLDIAKSKVTKSMDANGRGDEEIDDDAVRCVMKEQGYRPEIYENASFLGIEHIEGGIVAEVETPPIPKFRMVFLIKEPFVFAEVHKEQLGAINIWKKEIIPNIAAKIGIPYDHTGVDPSRLFLLPRYREGQPHECIVVGGGLIDWKDFRDEVNPLEAALEGLGSSKSTSKSQTPAGKKLGEWWSKRATGFMAADLIQNLAPDYIRADVSLGLEVVCPFDEEHSNPGDPEDRACLVTNTGELSPDYFTWACQHEGCREYTALDMVGKCITNEWFTEEDIWSEDYNAVEGLEGPKTDKVAEIEAKIASIKGKLRPTEMNVLTGIISAIADLNDHPQEQLFISAVSKKVDLRIEELRNMLVRLKTARRAADGGDKDDDIHRTPYEYVYYGSVDGYKAKALVSEAVNSLNNDADGPIPYLTYNEGTISRLVRSPGGFISFQPVNPNEFHAETIEVIRFIRRTDAGDQPPEFPHKSIVDAVYGKPSGHFARTPIVSRAPIFTSDGKLLANSGYYPDHEVYIELGDLVIPDVDLNPSLEYATSRMNFLRQELLFDFPFNDRDQDGVDYRHASEAAAIAMILEPIVTRMIKGMKPLHLCLKPLEGTGATLLGEIAMYLSSGFISSSIVINPKQPDEFGKLKVSWALNQPPHVFVDNAIDLECTNLMGFLTATEFGGRILGTSKTVSAPRTLTMIATGISPYMGKQMQRRTSYVSLDLKAATAAGRFYKHKKLMEWVKDNRADLLHALLICVQYWISQGSKPYSERTLESYESWAEVMGGIIAPLYPEHAFLANRPEAFFDQDHQAQHEFVEANSDMLIKGVQLTDLITSSVCNEELTFIRGFNEQEKRKNLRKDLNTLQNRAFDLDGKVYRLIISQVKKAIVVKLEDVGVAAIG